MALSAGKAQDIVQEWNLRTGQAVRNVDKLYRSIRKEQTAEKKLTVVRAELDSQTKSITRSFKKMNRSVTASLSQMKAGMTMSFAKGQLLTSGVMALGRSLAQSARDSAKFAQAQAIFTGDIEKARKATRGLASDLDLMVAKNRLNTLGVKMNNDQYAEMLGNLTKLAAAMSIDLDFALESATTMLARQSTAVADNVGVVIKAEEAYEKFAIAHGKLASQLTPAERKIAFQTEALRQMTEKAAELPDGLKTAGSELKNFSNEWKNFTNEIGGAIAKSDTLTDSLGGIAYIIRSTLNYLDDLNEGIADLFSDAGINRGGLFVGLNRAERERGKLLGADSAARKEIDKQAGVFRGGATVMGGGFGEAGSEFGLMGAPKVLGLSEEGTGRKRVSARGGRAAAEKKPKTALEAFEDLTSIDPGEIREVSAELLAEIDQLEARRAELMAGPSPMSKAAEEIYALGESQRQVIEWETQLGNISATQGEKIKNAYLQAMIGPDKFKSAAQGAQDAMISMADIGESTMASLAGSIWQMAAEAIESGEAFPKIMLKMLKSVTLGLAAELTARGVAALLTGKALAMNPFTAAAAPFFLTQGSMFLSYAGIVGAMGLAATGLSAATKSGGGGSTSAGSGTSFSAGSDQSSIFMRENQTKFAEEKEVETGPQYIQVYIGDPGSPAAFLIAQKQIDEQTNRVTQAKFSEI